MCKKALRSKRQILVLGLRDLCYEVSFLFIFSKAYISMFKLHNMEEVLCWTFHFGNWLIFAQEDGTGFQCLNHCLCKGLVNLSSKAERSMLCVNFIYLWDVCVFSKFVSTFFCVYVYVSMCNQRQGTSKSQFMPFVGPTL